jgi:hypothetical protein
LAEKGEKIGHWRAEKERAESNRNMVKQSMDSEEARKAKNRRELSV